MRKIFDVNSQLILNEVYDKVAQELEKEFYLKLGHRSEKVSRGYFRMNILMPLAQTAIEAILDRLFQKNVATKQIVLSKDLSQKNSPSKDLGFSLRDLVSMGLVSPGIDENDAEDILRAATKVLLSINTFRKPQVLIQDHREYTVQLHR
ncbi:MAG: hypothetical protein HYT98_01990 [Candidatus Sungbacteria bacterium]|nr:hypothetical protein [Candidatus Sungbacteria bacterium]